MSSKDPPPTGGDGSGGRGMASCTSVEIDVDDVDPNDFDDVSSTESVPAYYNNSDDDDGDIPDGDGNVGLRRRGRNRRSNIPTFVVLPPTTSTTASSSSQQQSNAGVSADNTSSLIQLLERRRLQNIQYQKRHGRPLFVRQESVSGNITQDHHGGGGSIDVGDGEKYDIVGDHYINPVDVEEARIRRQTSNHGSFGVVVPHGTSKNFGGTNKDDDCSCEKRPYRRDQLAKEIDDAMAMKTTTSGDSDDGRHGSFNEVLKTLQNAGVIVYLVDGKQCVTVNDMVDAVDNGVISHVLKHRTGPRSTLKCCLYRDIDGRLFNLTLAKSYTANEGTFIGLLQSFSIVQATALLVVLCRSFSCAAILGLSSTNGGNVVDDGGDDVPLVNFRPAYLGLIVGLVFSEEIGQSWVNAAMLVRGFPSIAALALKEGSMAGSDWLRKALVFVLAIAGYTTGRYQEICTLLGLSLTCLVLLVNLGSRSWFHIGYRPIAPAQCGMLGTIWTSIYAYIMAALCGVTFPYLGHRQGGSGGTAAVESVLRIAIVVAALFVLSDYDEIQEFIVVGSKNCNQDYVNFAVGAWWCLSLISCLTVLFLKDQQKRKNGQLPNQLVPGCILPDDDEPLLDEEHASPVGFVVPGLPSFPVDPSQVDKGWGALCCFTMGLEYTLGLLVAIGVGGFICYLGVTDADDKLLQNAF